MPRATDVRGEASPLSLWRHGVVQAERVLRGWLTDPATAIQTLIYPALTLVVLWIVLGKSITTATGSPSVYGTVPMITLIAAMSGSIVSALGLNEEVRSGLLARMWTMPVHRAAGLIGRMLAETVRITLTSLLIVAIGYLLDFRFTQGPVATLAFFGVPILFGLAFAVAITTVATITDGAILISLVSLATSLMLFFNSGFVPVYAYPDWLQGVVGNQPMSCAIDAMRGLSFGGPVAEPMLKTVAWTVGTIVVLLYPAVRGYRKAAQNSN
ncbi:ABC transporter permease [Aldersonia sp. NBC_00410]|uniref:ABC transporter permease n=1 Tax=Aldersonia sp. NBC_00410 TaxID=2975954 RepID=UPI002254EB45|nr:ABC transporter permease [Aldersonia sp. NBC_00410]MCX5045883.1 ABC transporter permease [Aldersonia sp. NBC_00410]